MKDDNKLTKMTKNKKKIMKAIISMTITTLIFGLITTMTFNRVFAERFLLISLLILCFAMVSILIFSLIGGFDDN